MWFTRFALKRPVTIAMVFVCAIVTGLASVRLIPLEMFPEIQFPGIFVQVNYPGSTPEEVERQITRPLEETLATIDGITRMQSTSTENQSSVFMLFDWSANTKLKGVEAREKVDNIRDQLPEDVQRIFVFTGGTQDEPVMQLRISSPKDLADSWQVLNRQLKQGLERIPGVSKVDIYGVAPKTYQIRLQPESLAAYNIDTNKLLSDLQSANALIAAGELKGDENNIRVTINDKFKDQQAMADFIVNARGIKLGDIADIRLANEELTGGRHLNREFAVGVNVSKEAGANLVATAEAIQDELERIRELPDFADIDVLIVDNSGDEVTTSLKDIAFSGSVGFFLSFLVLLFFLRDIRLTLIVSLAVPFSLTITLAVIYLTGYSLNLLSMMGLMLGVGMLVDNAVVVSESIFTRRSEVGATSYQAAILGVKDVGLPVIAGTLTTAIVFLPNIIGAKVSLTIFLAHVAISIVVALAASLFIATTIIPLLLSRIPITAKEKNTQAEPKQVLDFDKKTSTHKHYQHGRYSRLLAWLLNRPLIAGVVTICLGLVIAIPIQFVKVDLLNSDQNNELNISYNVLGTHELERVEGMVTRVEDFLFAHKEELDLVDVYSYFDQGYANSQLLLKEKEDRKKSLEEIRNFVEDGLPKFSIAKPGFERIGGGENGFVVMLQGDDSSTLWNLYREITPRLENITGVVQVRALIALGGREAVVSLDSQRIHQLGLTPESVAQTIGTALRKRQLRTFRGDFDEIDISLSLFEGNDRATLDQLQALPIALEGNRQARLDSMATFSIQDSIPQVRRNDRQTSIALRLEYRDGEVSSQQVRRSVTNVMGQIDFPAGYRWQFGQQLQQAQQEVNVMGINMLLAILMIFVVMAALFESLLFPLAAISSIFYGVVGVYWFYFITGTTMTIMGMIGILVLMGVVVNNAIVLIDRINTYRNQGLAQIDAILQAANDRIRPILMTVLTTILGLLPLSMGDTAIGASGPPYYPMARAVIGGLAYSTVATLICLPIIYLFLDNVRNFYAKLWQTSARKDTRFRFNLMQVSTIKENSTTKN